MPVVSEFSSPPVSPERATDASGVSSGSAAVQLPRTQLKEAFQHYYDPRGEALEGEQQGGFPPSYYASSQGVPCAVPTREVILEHIKGQLQGRYNEGSLSKQGFVAIAKTALAEVLQQHAQDGVFLQGGWEGRCEGVVERCVHEMGGGGGAVTVPSPQSDRSKRSNSVASVASSGVSSAATATARLRQQARRSPSPATYTSIASGKTPKMDTAPPPSEDPRSLRTRRLRDLRKKHCGGGAPSASPSGTAFPSPVLRDITNQSAKISTTTATHPQKEKEKAGVGADALHMMSQGLGRLETLSDRILRAQSPQEAEIFLHELRSYHFYALVAAGSPAETVKERKSVSPTIITDSVTSFETMSREQIETSAEDAFLLIEKSAKDTFTTLRLLEHARTLPPVDDQPEEEWIQYTAPNGVPYYYNTKSGETSWVPPTEGAEAVGVGGGGGGGGADVAIAPPKEEVVEYIRSLLQPLYNSGAMSQTLFLDVIRSVSKSLLEKDWQEGSDWKVFVCKKIEGLVS